MEILSQWIVPILIALIAGAFGSFFSPLAHWNIEKKKLIFEAKKQLINDIRKHVSTSFSILGFKETDFYYKIKGELNEELKNRICNTTLEEINEMIYGDYFSEYESKIKHQLLNELNDIAKRWKIE
jgi:hypothetical protein